MIVDLLIEFRYCLDCLAIYKDTLHIAYTPTEWAELARDNGRYEFAVTWEGMAETSAPSINLYYLRSKPATRSARPRKVLILG